MKTVEGLRKNPRPSGVKQLKRPGTFLRLRVGDYRAIYLEGRLVALVVRIGARKNVCGGLETLGRRVKGWMQSKPQDS